MNAEPLVAVSLVIIGIVICLTRPELRPLAFVLILGSAITATLLAWRIVLTATVVGALVILALGVLFGVANPVRALVAAIVALIIAFVLTAAALQLGQWLEVVGAGPVRVSSSANFADTPTHQAGQLFRARGESSHESNRSPDST